MKARLSSLVVGLALVFVSLELTATTYYVSLSGDGSDPTAGYATGYTHPQAAINAAVAAGVSAENPAEILVDDGTYQIYQSPDYAVSNRVVNITSSYIHLKARNSRQAILDGQEILDMGSGTYTSITYRPLTIAGKLEDVTVDGFVIMRGVSVMSTSVSDPAHLYAASGLLTDMEIKGRWVAGTPMVYLAGSAVVSNFTFSAPSRRHYNSNRGTPSCFYLTGSAKLYNGTISDIAVYDSYMSTDPCFQAVYMTSANNLMRNCLVKGNTNGKNASGNNNVRGGGVYASAGTIESCTIVGNTAWGKGGGLYLNGSVTVRNTIVWGNAVKGSNAEGADIYVASGKTPTIEYCDASTGLTAGENGNYSVDPHFGADGVTPLTDSSLPGKGYVQEWMAGAKDLAGNARLWTDETLTIGAYETQGRVSVFTDFATVGGVTVGHAPFTVYFTSEVSVEGVAGTTYTWTFGDGTGLTNTLDSAPSHVYQKPGKYAVKLSVNVPGVGPASAGPKADYIVAGSDTYYVSPDGDETDPVAGYATGFKHPQTAINEAVKTGTSATSPVTIYVDDGTYAIYESPDYAVSNRVVNITTDGIRLRARNSRKAILDGEERRKSGGASAGSFRPLTIASGLTGVEVTGFSIRRGVGPESTDVSASTSIYAASGFLSDMEIIGHWTSGTPFVTLTGSSVVSNFTFTMPTRKDWNANRGTPSCFYLAGNAKLFNGAISNVAAFANIMCETPNYQAVYMTSSGNVMRNCLVQGNTNGKENKGISWEVGYNNVKGGGVYASAGTIENCTVVSNTAWGKGGGIYIAGPVTLRNTVIWGNFVKGPNAADADICIASGATPTIEHCDASTGLTAGENGNINADPLFVDDGTGYRITTSSPCFNAGMKLDWCAKRGMATDLDGQERRRNRPDIGCFEVQTDLGLLLFLR